MAQILSDDLWVVEVLIGRVPVFYFRESRRDALRFARNMRRAGYYFVKAWSL